MPQTRWTRAISGLPCRYCRPARAPQNLQSAAEVHSLVAVETDEHKIARIKMQCSAITQVAAIFSSPVKRMARGVVLAAEPGPSSWRNAAIAAIGHSVGGPAVLRDWIGTWTQAMVPHCTAKLWTAATIAEETEAWATFATTLPTQASPRCSGRGLGGVDGKLRH